MSAKRWPNISRAGASVNFATLIGHNTVRAAVMGTANRLPTIPELTRMRSLVWRAMADGAVGFSTGLQYVPGTYAKTPEIIDLARVAGNAGGVYAIAHAERRDGARGGGGGDDSRRLDDRRAGADLAPESRQPEPLGRQRPGAGDDRRRPQPRRRRDGRPVRLHRGELDARHPFSVVGARGRTDRDGGAPGRSAQWARIKREMAGLLAERGLEDLSFAVVASHAAEPVAERPRRWSRSRRS